MLTGLMTGIISTTGLINKLSGSDLQLEKLTVTLFVIMLAVAFTCFLVSELTRNYSQVDKLWSLMPIVYCIVSLAAFPSPRLLIMTILVALWGLRLSYNFYRKGGYNIIPWKGEEDYRWKIMQEHPVLKGRFRFGLFNLLFISLYQNILILLFSTPVLLAARYSSSGLNWLDFAAGILMILFIALESIADNQQLRFQNLKKIKNDPDSDAAKAVKKGFVTSGLWAYARHPNFAAEQGVWICFYLFGVSASGDLLNWTMAGPVLLVLLFQGSTALTEKISCSKYPSYEEYKRDVPRFIPWRIKPGRINMKETGGAFEKGEN